MCHPNLTYIFLTLFTYIAFKLSTYSKCETFSSSSYSYLKFLTIPPSSMTPSHTVIPLRVEAFWVSDGVNKNLTRLQTGPHMPFFILASMSTIFYNGTRSQASIFSRKTFYVRYFLQYSSQPNHRLWYQMLRLREHKTARDFIL